VSLAPTEAKAEIVIRVFRQYADFLKSKMYRNDRRLVTCSDCHDMHGNMPYPRWLIHDPNNAASPLCQRCHTVNVLTHMETKLNARMKGELTRCIDCHMPGTAHTGVFAGDFGRMIKTPPYASAQEEEANAYWQSPMRSHVFDVPLRTNVAVDGGTSGSGDAHSIYGGLRHMPRCERVAVQITRGRVSVIEQLRVLDDERAP
jgi:hypothetical protein